MRHRRHRHLVVRLISLLLIIVCLYAYFRPWLLGGASPVDRIVRVLQIEKQLNPAEIFTDALSYAAGSQSGSFDMDYNGAVGTLSYAMQDGVLHVLIQTQQDSYAEQKYISVGNGYYSEYRLTESRWQCTEKREMSADITRLWKSFVGMVNGKETDTVALEEDLNALTDTDWSDYFIFPNLPSAVQSVFNLFSQAAFLSRLGFSYGHDGPLLTYRTIPQDSQYVAQQISAALAPAYTSRTQTIVDIADIAGKVTKAIGWDIYQKLLGSEIYFTVHPLTGSIQELCISGQDLSLHLTVRNYGNTTVNIASDDIH